MDLGGNLEVLDPAMVFQVASICELTGKMKFITVDNVASCWFQDGHLLCATIDTRRKTIGRYLIENEVITEEQLERSLEERRSSGKGERIGDILVRKGFLELETLKSSIQEQMKEVVYEVLPWKEGQFVFFSGAEPEDEDIFLDVRMDHLILEGLKRIDEAARD